MAMVMLLLLLPHRHDLFTAGGHNFVKDIVVAVSVIVAVGGCYFAYSQHRRAQTHIHRLMKDLSSLQNAEDALSQLQDQYVFCPFYFNAVKQMVCCLVFNFMLFVVNSVLSL